MIGKEMRNLRERLGLTQAEFAKALDKSLVSINRWENQREDALPDDIGQLLNGLKSLADAAEKRTAKVSLHELRSALLSQAGVLGVVVAAASAGLIPRVIVACIVMTPGLGWIAAAAGLGASAILPFFQKVNVIKKKEKHEQA